MNAQHITKINLMGSPSRDKFKFWHKQAPMPRNFYACDIDFVLIEKDPPHIVAIMDYKMPQDELSWTECITFNDLVRHYPIYIIYSNADFVDFKIYRYAGCDDLNSKPLCPRLVNKTILHGQLEYIKWEANIRRNL
jgi:CheY-like chemotaxis protein